MKIGKRIAALLLCALLVLLSCIGCGKKNTTETLSDQELVSNETRSLVYKNGTYTLRFEKNADGDWQWRDDTTLPLDQDKMQQLLDQVSALNTLPPLENPGDTTTYDLDSPDRTLEIANADGTSLSLQLGVAVDGGGYYMCRDADLSKIFIAPDTLVQLMDRSIYELVKLPSVPALKSEQLQSVQVVTSDGTDKTIVQGEDGKWLCAGKDVTEAFSAAAALLESGQWLVSCVDYNPSNGALPICGLDSPQLTATVQYKDIAGNDASIVLKIGLPYGDGFYAYYNDIPAIFMISGETTATLIALSQLGA